MSELHYDFLPWARRGLARAHANQQALGAPVQPAVQVGLQLKGSVEGEATASAGIALPLMGPADVIGLDPRVIVRMEPRANQHDVEPNYLAAIEFDPPDLPWLLTPARANAQERLMPWLTLLVFRRGEVDEPIVRPGRPLPSVTLKGLVSLPDLSEAWMWGHAQVVRASEGPDAIEVDTALNQRPAQNLSRLVCPRRLEANQGYIACLVPVFEQGRRAGLGQAVAADALLSLAWQGTQASDLELPVYHHWTFSTGPAGDFETLARRLKTPADLGSDVQQDLGRLGREPVEIDADHLFQQRGIRQQGAAAVQAAYVDQYEGAMLSLAPDATVEPGQTDQVAADLARFLNAGEQRVFGNLALADHEPEVPLVGPPVYGAWHARAHAVNPALRERWLHHLNLLAPARMAAGVGTRVVQAHQEAFMQAAWSQMGEVLKAQRMLSLAHVSVHCLGALQQRLAHLPPERRMQFLAPAAARLPLGPDAQASAARLTLWGHVRQTSLPDAVAEGGLRRGLASSRNWVRRAQVSSQAGATATRPGTALAQAFADPTSVRTLAEAPRFRTDGIRALRALDGLALPDAASAPNARLDVPGLGQGLPAALLGRLMATQKTLQALPPQAFRQPGVQARLKAGVLLDAQWSRIGELGASLAEAALQTRRPTQEGATPLTMAQSLLAVGRQRPEGVLLSAVVSETGFRLAAAQGLNVDARSGRLDLAPAATASPSARATLGAAQRAPTLKAGAIATVPIPAARGFQPGALFQTLPVGALTAASGRQAPPLQIGASEQGRFRPQGSGLVGGPVVAPEVGGRIGVTTLPPVHDAHVLERMRGAWARLLAREAPVNLGRGVTVQAVPCVASEVLHAALPALNAATLVPRRIQSLIGAAGSPFRYDTVQPGVIGRSLLSRERFVLPQQLDRVMAYPRLDEPLYRKLAELDRDAFLPGAQEIPNDTILLLQTNPGFVNAFLAGANHEMGREMLWRGYPTDQRGTPFQRFWPYFDPQARDIDPIHQWNASATLRAAGGHNPQGQLVLLVRGQLLRRYPNTHVYAIAKQGGDKAAIFDSSQRQVLPPVAAGQIQPDISFFLFNLPPSDANRYWFVLEEPMTEPRFGFDDSAAPREVPRVKRRGGQVTQRVNFLAPQAPPSADSWLDVDWADVGTAAGQHVSLAQLAGVHLHAIPAKPRSVNELPAASAHAGQVAAALLQRPFRGFFDGDRLDNA
ncbi:hypothetical protein [Aquabacterium sp.]|uniref:hypothetical protein n=1 Tax=Aquabacterium sp. TaxID=1872578 RepID=UPI0025BA9C0E|nr:hypothetical protein [Aquabacterium sp.]